MAFIVKNTGNMCYIDSILMALFYSDSTINNILKTDVEDTISLYLQEFIKLNFVEKVKNGVSVQDDSMNMMRDIIFHSGWLNRNCEEYFEQQDVSEFYTFLLNKFGGPLLEIQRSTVYEDDSDGVSSTSLEKIPFIPLHLPISGSNVKIKTLLNSWMHNNYTEVKRDIILPDGTKTTQNINGLNSYNIINTPNFVGLSINRYTNSTSRNGINVIIQKKISFSSGSNFYGTHEWIFHAAVCHKGESTKSGHYYTLLADRGGYYIFDDLEVPCLNEVRMDDPVITNMVKKECVFLIYRFSV